MKYLLYGYGRTIQEVERVLRQKRIDYKILISKEENKLYPNLDCLHIETITDEELNTFSKLVRSPGIPHYDGILERWRQMKKPIVSEIELAYSFNPNGTIVGVTGSNGKTSTINYVYNLIKDKYPTFLVGNNDIPYISKIDKINKESIVLVELSNFQLENTYKFKPKIALITNLAPNHLDKVESLDFYYKSKFNLFKNMGIDDYIVVNSDDNLLLGYGKRSRCQKVFTSVNDKADIYLKDDYLYMGNEQIVGVNKLKIVGKHNYLNLLQAIAIASILGCTLEEIKGKCINITAVKYRLEYLKQYRGISIYNDGKSTTPESTLAAINAFNNQKVQVILGGLDKNLDYSILNQAKQARFYAFGQARFKIQQQIAGTMIFLSLEQAINTAINKSKPGDVVLFSPACASFDRFKNYIERSKYFEQSIFHYLR